MLLPDTPSIPPPPPLPPFFSPPSIHPFRRSTNTSVHYTLHCTKHTYDVTFSCHTVITLAYTTHWQLQPPLPPISSTIPYDTTSYSTKAIIPSTADQTRPPHQHKHTNKILSRPTTIILSCNTLYATHYQSNKYPYQNCPLPPFPDPHQPATVPNPYSLC